LKELEQWFNPERVKSKEFSSRGVSVETRELVKIYRLGSGISVQALRGVNMDVKSGEVVTIMGPSGSGKTTLLNILGGIDKPSGGAVKIGGVEIQELGEGLLEKYRLSVVGYIFQTFNLIPVLTAMENVALPMIAFNVAREVRVERARWLLEIVGLGDRLHHKPYELSGGQQQRVAIAVALANDPPLILADEPTAELDTENAMNIIGLLTKLGHEYGKTVIVSTHDPRMAVRTDRIYRLEDGRIIGEYKPIELGEERMVRDVDLTELIKTRLANVERDIEHLVEKLRMGELSLEEFDEKYIKLRNQAEILRELLRSMGH